MLPLGMGIFDFLKRKTNTTHGGGGIEFGFGKRKEEPKGDLPPWLDPNHKPAAYVPPSGESVTRGVFDRLSKDSGRNGQTLTGEAPFGRTDTGKESAETAAIDRRSR